MCGVCVCTCTSGNITKGIYSADSEGSFTKYVKKFNLRLNLGNRDQNPHFINVETEAEKHSVT